MIMGMGMGMRKHVMFFVWYRYRMFFRNYLILHTVDDIGIVGQGWHGL